MLVPFAALRRCIAHRPAAADDDDGDDGTATKSWQVTVTDLTPRKILEMP
jgi:hypothetical protein